MEQIYHTLYNGSKPYKIIISTDNFIKIYDNNNMLILEKQANKVFVNTPPNTFNTLLIEVADYTYIYVGDKIFTFMSYNQIVEYNSPIGNNMVPYPFAIDNKGWIYLLVYQVVIMSIPIKFLSDPYDYYLNYGLKNICLTPTSAMFNHPPIITNFQNIEKFFIGENQYVLSYCPFADQVYDQITSIFDSDLSIELIDNTRILLNKSKYIQLMKDYEFETGIYKFDYFSILHKYDNNPSI